MVNAAMNPVKTAQSINKIPTIPKNVLVGLVLAIILDTGVQICWKMAVMSVPENAGIVDTMLCTLKQPLFFGVIVMFLSQLYNWMKVLGHADLSFAQPITSLSYISVCIISALCLHETVRPLQIAGIALVLAGVWFISQTDHASAQTAVESPEIAGSAASSIAKSITEEEV
ncbi:MAG TPA: EamA family transporter [Chroococcales cyanobacterium]